MKRQSHKIICNAEDWLVPSQIFPGIFIFLASVRDVLFYFLKFLEKLKKIEYADLRSKCSRIYSDTKLSESGVRASANAHSRSYMSMHADPS